MEMTEHKILSWPITTCPEDLMSILFVMTIFVQLNWTNIVTKIPLRLKNPALNSQCQAD